MDEKDSEEDRAPKRIRIDSPDDANSQASDMQLSSLEMALMTVTEKMHGYGSSVSVLSNPDMLIMNSLIVLMLAKSVRKLKK